MAFGLSSGAVSLIGAGASLLGGVSGSNAVGQGANAQMQANQMGIDEQRRATAQQREDLMSFANSGKMADNERMRRLGLGGNGRIGSFTPKTMEQLRGEMRGQFTRSNTQANNAMPPRMMGMLSPGDRGEPGSWQTIYNPGVYDKESNNTTGNYLQSVFVPNPVDEAGLEAAAQAAFNAQGAAREGEIDPEYGSLMRKFGQRDLDTDLVYQNGLEFGRKTGENALNQRMAAGGSYGSGAALKALTRFANDYATTKTEGAYKRNMGEKNQIYDMLTGVSNAGQSAAAGQGAAGLSGANSISKLYGGIGDSQAAGAIGSANAMNQGLAGATNALQWNQLINRRPATSSVARYSGSSTNPFAANYENSFDLMNG